jgi:uncharacterized lipoprotein YbaY
MPKEVFPYSKDAKQTCTESLRLGGEMGAFVIRGWIRLPSPEQLDGAVATIGLDDVTMLDASSVRVAETSIDPVHGLNDRIPFQLTVDESRLQSSNAYILSAAIWRSGKRALSPGDFATTAAYPWTVGDSQEHILDVTRV